MKLTYWYAENKRDRDCYSVVAKTKKEAQAQVQALGVDRFEPVEKRTLEYTDGFDMFELLTSEGGCRGIGYKE